MGWATGHIEALSNGQAVRFRAPGSSMSGRIAKGDLVVVVPPPREPRKDDVVLCRVRAQYCHLVTAVRNGRYQISNNHGHVNGWIGRGGIFGIAEPVRP